MGWVGSHEMDPWTTLHLPQYSDAHCCGFTTARHKTGHFRDVSPKPISWLGVEKTYLTQQKHAFTNQKKCITTLNKHKILKPGLVAFYDIRSGNGAGLFSKGKDK